MSNVTTISNRLAAETTLWRSRVNSVGGGLEWNSVAIANGFIRRLKTKSYYGKVKYLLPLLGKGINAARVPLIDTLNVGAATNTSFVDADYNQSIGLQGNGSSKILDSLIKPSQLGASNNAGIGYWENNMTLGSNVEPMGCYDSSTSNRFVFDLRNNPFIAFRWGNPANVAFNSITPLNGHYYGQRASITSRILYFNAINNGSDSTSDSASGASDTNIGIVGAFEPSAAPWPGRCAMAYMTDGTLTVSEISDFDTLIRSFLLGPTGKPQS